MAYIEVDVDLDQFDDGEIIQQCKNRADPEFIGKLREIFGETQLSSNSDLWSIAKDMQSGKDVTEKLKNYIWNTVGVIV